MASDEPGAVQDDISLHLGQSSPLVSADPSKLPVHKSANVLNKLPKRQQSKASRALHESYPTRSHASLNRARSSDLGE
jgi:hypothetical protein